MPSLDPACWGWRVCMRCQDSTAGFTPAGAAMALASSQWV